MTDRRPPRPFPPVGAMTAGPLTRRRFLERAGLALGAVAFGPALLAACGSDDDSGSGGNSGGGGGGGSTDIAISNWTSYMTKPLLKEFEQATGISVDYREDINDNNEYFAKIRPNLSKDQSIDTDGFVFTDWMVNRIINTVEWAQPLDEAKFPNKANMSPALANPAFDPGRKYSAPWATGVTGIAYNIETTGTEIRTIDDYLAAPGTKTALSEMRDTVGLFMLSTGADPTTPSYAAAGPAFDKLQKAVDDGDITQFTGNEYVGDLGAGDIAAAIAWSGDVAQITVDNPDVRFVIPDAGGMLWSDNFMIPYTSDKAAEATEFINFFYDPGNAAELMAFIQFISPVVGVADQLRALGGDAAKLADNPLVVPTEEFLASLNIFGPLDDEEEVKFDTRFAEISGSG
ncbi:MAG: polyamine ABC transporter substrate-binding protein [Acidimicrobiia bacterium]